MAPKGKQKAYGTALLASLVFVLCEVTGKLDSENMQKVTTTGHSAGLVSLRISKRYRGEGFRNKRGRIWEKILNFRNH